MCTPLRRRPATAVLLLVMILAPLSTTTATAAAAPTVTVQSATGWTYYATYPTHDSCAAAGRSDASGHSWKCVVSARPGAFDLYFSTT